MYLAKNWWLFLARGILALILGIFALFFPEVVYMSIVLIIGVFALVDGAIALFSAFTSNAKSEHWWWIIFEGVLGILLGVLTIFRPAAMGEVWMILIAVWAILTGILEIITAVALRKAIEGEIWMILGGVVSLLFGVLLLIYPTAGAIAIGIIIGVFAILFGIFFILLAFRLKKFNASGSAEEPSIA
jgi:uncharacterized membrane protein HdeD (DUF308 family)